MSFGSVCGKILTRGAGATALYLVARDAHHYGKIQADCDRKTKDSVASEYYLENTMTLNKPSHTKNNLQQNVFRFELSHNFRGFVNATIGYFKGFFGNLVSDVLPLGLGLVALLAKGAKNAKTGKHSLGLPAKASALALAGMAVFSLFYDGLGIGKFKPKI